MAKNYEDLTGAVGREQLFRRPRYDAVEFFCGEPPALHFDDLVFEIRNISGSGIGASMRKSSGAALEKLNVDGVLKLVQHGEELFIGKARCARVEHLPGKVFSGFALDGDQFDLAELRRQNVVAISKIGLGPSMDVAPEYRAFCSDALAFVGAHAMRIQRMIGPIEATWSESDKEEFFAELLASVEPEWRDILYRGNRYALEARSEKKLVSAMKRYTEAAVTPALVAGASWNRCYFKPMGYPGDYKIMNYMYDQRPEGASVKEQFLHGLGIVAGKPIHTRMLKLSELVVDHCKRFAGDEACRIASIGCGPARELEHIVSKIGDRRIAATLIDQEIEALEYAVNFASQHDPARKVAVKALNTSFKSMFNPFGIDALRNQDVIYSLGLVDYFSPLVARRFVTRAYELIRPGGKVIIGNASDSANGTYWTMEHVLDWSLFFRNQKEMADLAADIPDAIVSVEADPLDSIYFLVAEKPCAADSASGRGVKGFAGEYN